MNKQYSPPLSISVFILNLVIRVFGVILASLLILPLAISFLSTSIPPVLNTALLIIDLLLIFLYFRFSGISYRPVVLFSGLSFVFILCVVASQFFASTPPILVNDGQPLPGSIASLEQVELNGSPQWITIRGKDTSKPVLLYLGIGGPGAGGFPATSTSLRPLEDHFVVVNWDQPGTGKSYSSRPINSLNTQVFVNDARALTEILRQRFNVPKIYILGLSWGTIVGTNLIDQYPDLYYAYVGNGQMVNTVENDQFGYDLALQITADKNDSRINSRLKKNGPPPYTGPGLGLKYADYNNVLFDYMNSPGLPVIMALLPQLSREYGWIDKINFDRGLYESFTAIYPQLTQMDFITDIPEVKVPVYFLVGRQDVNAVASIVERYYDVLQAPYKELVWVASGHGATADEIRDTLVNKVLVNSPPVN